MTKGQTTRFILIYFDLFLSPPITYQAVIPGCTLSHGVCYLSFFSYRTLYIEYSILVYGMRARIIPTRQLFDNLHLNLYIALDDSQ